MSDESGYTDARQIGPTTTFSRLCLTDGRKYLVIEQDGQSVKLDRYQCERVMEMADKFIPDGKVRGFGMAGKMTEGTTVTYEFPCGWVPVEEVKPSPLFWRGREFFVFAQKSQMVEFTKPCDPGSWGED